MVLLFLLLSLLLWIQSPGNATMDLMDINKCQRYVLNGMESIYEPIVWDEPSVFEMVTEDLLLFIIS